MYVKKLGQNIADIYNRTAHPGLEYWLDCEVLRETPSTDNWQESEKYDNKMANIRFKNLKIMETLL